MKKIILMLLCVVLCVSCFTGCGKKVEEQVVEDVVITTPVVEEEINESEEQKVVEEEKEVDIESEEEDLLKDLDEEIFKRIDGSTATIPVSESLALEILGEDADMSVVKHNRTSMAYERLINGEVDLIFVTPPSEEEQKMLEQSKNGENGTSFDLEKFAKEGFVFLVNENNKVESLSVDEIQNIYKNEITNWKDVGGEDANIKPYQRPENSGSQTLMYKLVAPKEDISGKATIEIVESMMGLVEAVANYEGGKDSIGYSVYYYINDMIDLGESKLLKINGVLPSVETIKDGSYPLVDGYYMIYNANLDPEDDIYKLINYLRSEKGQKMIEEAGYVPVN